MAKYSFSTLSEFDKNLPRSLALTRHFNHTLDFLKKIVASEDNLGLAYLLFTPAEFVIRFGHAPIVRVHPGPFAGTTLEQRNIQVALEGFLEHEAAKAFAIMEIFRVWPTDIKRLCEDENDSLDYRPLHEHYAALRAALPVSETDIAMIKSAVSKAYKRTDLIDAFVKDQLNNIARLANNNHALNTAQSVEMMQSAFTTTAQDRQDFQACFDQFMHDNPLPATRTAQAFAIAVSTYTTNLLPHFSAKNNANRANAVTEELTLSTDERAELVALRTAAAQPPPAHPKTAARHAKKKSLPIRLTARALQAGAPTWYCHSCGADFQLGYEHYSCECRDRKQGHQKHATFTNQMGGKKA